MIFMNETSEIDVMLLLKILWHLLNSCDVYIKIHFKILVTCYGLSIVLN